MYTEATTAHAEDCFRQPGWLIHQYLVTTTTADGDHAGVDDCRRCNRYVPCEGTCPQQVDDQARAQAAFDAWVAAQEAKARRRQVVDRWLFAVFAVLIALAVWNFVR